MSDRQEKHWTVRIAESCGWLTNVRADVVDSYLGRKRSRRPVSLPDKRYARPVFVSPQFYRSLDYLPSFLRNSKTIDFLIESIVNDPVKVAPNLYGVRVATLNPRTAQNESVPVRVTYVLLQKVNEIDFLYASMGTSDSGMPAFHAK